jgi:hypothetical protein
MTPDKFTNIFTDDKKKDKPSAAATKDEKKEAKKAVFLEPTKEEKQVLKEEKEAELKEIEQKYKDKENPALNPKWKGIVCGSCLQEIQGVPDLREDEEGEYQGEPVNYVQCSACKEADKPVRVFVQETEKAYIEVPRSSLDPEEEKKD